MICSLLQGFSLMRGSTVYCGSPHEGQLKNHVYTLSISCQLMLTTSQSPFSWVITDLVISISLVILLCMCCCILLVGSGRQERSTEGWGSWYPPREGGRHERWHYTALEVLLIHLFSE